ncbi:MAG: RraA family protein [Candidatus Dormibacteraceae bacterium]
MSLSSTLASDAAGGKGVLDASVKPIRSGFSVAAPATTVRILTDDNLDVRQALGSAAVRGSVLVVAGGAMSRAACIGGRLAREIHDAGVVAEVTDAPVRDSLEILELGLPVWSRGLTPIAPGKRGGGEVGAPVELAGVTVRSGDWVVADDDGVVVWPREQLQTLQERAAELELAERHPDPRRG